LMHFCPNAFATWPQSHRCNPAYSSFARSSHNLALQPFQSRVLLLTVNFLTHFDVCLVHLLLLMFRNRGFPTRCQPVYKHLSIYKHLLLAGETTSPNLTFLSSIKFCLDFSFSWLPILRFPCIIRFWSSTIGIPVHGWFWLSTTYSVLSCYEHTTKSFSQFQVSKLAAFLAPPSIFPPWSNAYSLRKVCFIFFQSLNNYRPPESASNMKCIRLEIDVW
jgi:hypothetical protein